MGSSVTVAIAKSSARWNSSSPVALRSRLVRRQREGFAPPRHVVGGHVVGGHVVGGHVVGGHVVGDPTRSWWNHYAMLTDEEASCPHPPPGRHLHELGSFETN